MPDAVVALLSSVLSQLKADAAVSLLVAARVYDRPPHGADDATYPFISLGPSDDVTDDAECIDGVEISFQIDAWSVGANEAYGSAQVRRIAGAVRAVLHDADLDLAYGALVLLRHERTRVMREPDGLTNHAAMTFTAIIELD